MKKDGYVSELSIELKNRYVSMKELIDKQIKLNDNISSVSKQLNTLPEIPVDMNEWIESLSESDQDFKLKHFKILFKKSKEYNKLLEEKEKNSQKIKIVVIDNLIEQIKGMLEK